MADCYLRSTDGLDADGGTTWALAKATLAAAMTTAGSGGRVFMSQAHAETAAAALTETSPGVSGSPTAVICVSDAAEPPTALSTAGSVSNTGANNVAFNGTGAAYGFTVNVSSAASAAALNFTSTSPWHWIFRSCVLVLRATAAANRIVVGGTSGNQEALLELYASDMQFNATAQAINPGSTTKWYGGTLTLGTAPTGGLIKGVAGMSHLFEARAVDLNNLGTNPLVEVGQGVPGGYIDFIHCKISASHTVSTITTGTYDGLGFARLRMHRCRSDDTSRSWDLVEKDYCGTVESTNAIERVGGASDTADNYSHKMISSTGASFYAPLYSPRYAIPIFTVGSSLTLTVQIFIDQAAALTDADVFAELEYEGTSGNSLGVFTNTRRGILASNTNLTSSSATWTGSPTNPQARQIAITFTPQEVGVAFVRIGLMAASKTLYVDPPQRAQVA